jgi:molybdate-binding protein
MTPLPNVFLGSHDPLLDWALRESGCGIATFFDGSTDGLTRFVKREGIATGLHLYDPESESWNERIVAERAGGMPVALLGWAKRQRGLIVSEARMGAIGTIADLKGRKVAPRQADSGAQTLFSHLIERAGFTADDLLMTSPARTEADAALAVLEGKADAAFGLASFAAQYRLPFVPLIEEQFDLLVDRRAWFLPPMQKFIEFCQSEAFRTRAGELAGYDVSGFGRVRFVGA